MRPFMRAATRVALAATIAVALAGSVAAAQEATAVDPALRQRVEARFRVLPVQDGVVLTPRDDGNVQSIEIRRGLVAVDGEAVSGAQLRQRLGSDADLVLQLTYLDPAALARWGRPAPAGPADIEPVPPIPETASPPAPPDEQRDSTDETRQRDRWRRRTSAKVHIGSSVTVAEDEQVTDPVVAVGGSVTVLGRVDDDVVAVGGSVHLGPKAVVRGDVTAVGGRVEQEPGAEVGGTVNEVRIGGPHFRFNPGAIFLGFAGWDPLEGWVDMAWTVLRVGLVLLLAVLVLLVSMRPVERIAERAARDPWLSGFIGLLAQLLFIPVLVLVTVVLAISIIGIPLLVLVPFAVLLFLLAMLVGFTGVCYRVGRWAVGTARSPFLALTVGIVLIAAIALLANAIDVIPAPLWPLPGIVAAVGFLVEYIAWTVGLGAALLTRFGTRGPVAPGDAAPEYPPAGYPPPAYPPPA